MIRPGETFSVRPTSADVLATPYTDVAAAVAKVFRAYGLFPPDAPAAAPGPGGR